MKLGSQNELEGNKNNKQTSPMTRGQFLVSMTPEAIEWNLVFKGVEIAVISEDPNEAGSRLLFGLNIETAFSLSGLNCNRWCMAEEITMQIKSNNGNETTSTNHD